MAGIVLSVETFILSLPNATGSTTATLTKGQTLANCVPFITKRVTSGSDTQIENHQVDAWFSSTATLNLARDNNSGANTSEVTVVEFDPAKCQVITDSFNMSDVTGSAVYTFPSSKSVTVANAFLVFHSFQNSALDNFLPAHLLRGRITSTTQVTVDRGMFGGDAGTIDGHYFIVESTSGDFTVDHLDIALTGTSDTGTVSVTKANAILLGSWKATGTGDDANDENTVDATLTNDTTVTVQRANSTGTVDYAAQVVDMSDGTIVEHGTIVAQGATASQDETLTTSVDRTFSTAVIAGCMGSTVTGSFPGTAKNDMFDAQVQLTLQDSDSGGDFDEVRVQHATIGGEASNDISWEVIQWGAGAGTVDGIVSDDFSSGSLESHWTEVDPVGDLGPVTFEGSAPDQWVTFTIDAGAIHDTDTTAMEALQLIQTPVSGTASFEIEAKFETVMDTTQYKSYGLVCHVDAPWYIQLVAFYDGTGMQINFDFDGSTQKTVDISLPTPPFWLRIERTGNAWKGFYSLNGTGFTQVGTDHNIAAVTVDEVGVMAGNWNSTPSSTPEHIVKVDYFFENSNPVDPEDPSAPSTRRIFVTS